MLKGFVWPCRQSISTHCPHERVLSLAYLNSHSPAGLQAFDFVVESFRELQNKFKVKALRREISLDEKYLTDLIPTAAYKDPKTLYDKYTRSYSIAVNRLLKEKVKIYEFSRIFKCFDALY